MNNPFAILSLIIIIPFIGMLFVLTAKESPENKTHNSSDVAIFSVLANLLMIWRVFMLIDETKLKLQLFEKFDWLPVPDINLVFAVDNLSLLMILAIHIVILIGIVFSRSEITRQKPLMVLTLLFLSMTTGFFVAADIFSFFIFFEAMLLPLFMMIGMFGEFKRLERLSGFLLYNLTGALVLFAAVLLLYKSYGSLTLDRSDDILWNDNCGGFIWSALAFGFISRIPIWPFHHWISSVSSKIRNPLVFIASSILPLSGIYGLLRFWPQTIPPQISEYFIWINIIGTVTMLFISLISFIHKDPQYKIFAFITVYYIMYLLGIFSGDPLILQNICYALFGFLLVFGSLEAVSAYIYHQERLQESTSEGFLCRAKRLSLIYSFLTFAAAGFPVSAIFTNNFLILSQLLSVNIQLGTVLMLSCIIAAAALIGEMFRLKTDSKECSLGKDNDLPYPQFIFMMFVCFILLMSFIRPLWFVIDE